MTHNVLVVDDEVLVLETLADELRDIDCAVDLASSGEQALAKMRENSFDLVITDLVMEGVDGLEVLRQAKEMDPDLPVLVLTGYGDMGSAIAALRLRADDFVLKNYEIETLLTRVSNCLDRRDLNRKVRLYEKILPICSGCKKVRDDSGCSPGSGEWMLMERYLSRKSGVQVSHGMCDECLQKNYPFFES